MVIGHLGVIEYPPGKRQFALLAPGNALHKGLIGPRQLLQRQLGPSDHVHRQITAVGAGICDRLPFFIELLSQLQGFIRSKAQLAVCVPLQGGQVVKLRGQLFPGFGGDALHLRLFAPHQLGQLIRGFLIRNAVILFLVLVFGVKPLAGIVPEIRGESEVFLGLEIGNFMIPFYQNGQCGRLHTSDGQKCVKAQRERPAGIHANQPIRL